MNTPTPSRELDNPENQQQPAPRFTFLLYVAVMTALWAALPWLFLLLRSDAPMDVLTIYRHGGDPECLPFVSTLARGHLGEFVSYEHAGEGLISFPLPYISLHALFFSFMKGWGYPLGDMAGALLMVFSIVFFVRSFRLSWSLAWLAAAIVFASVPLAGWFEHAVGFRWSFPLIWWGDRFPRPSISNAFFLLFAGHCLRAWGAETSGRSTGQFALAGFFLSLLLQGDVHFALSGGMWTGLLLASMLPRVGWRNVLVRGLAFSAAFIVASGPFIMSRLLEHPDMPLRLGVFPMNRWPPLLEYSSQPGRILLVVLAFTSAILLQRRWSFFHLPSSVRWLFVLFIVTVFMLPLSGIVLGKNVQLYHYHDRIKIASSWFLLMLGLCVLSRGLSNHFAQLRRGWPLAVLIPVLVLILRASSLHAMGVQVPQKARDWLEVRRVLEEFPEGQVLATWNFELATWWLSYRAGYLYAPLALPCTLSDQYIEQRLVEQARLMGMPEDRFIEYIRIDSQWLGSGKYQASQAHTFMPLDAYSAEELKLIKGTTWTHWSDAWNRIVPRAELERLRALYRAASPATSRLDVVVAPVDLDMEQAQMEMRGFSRLFTNRSFQLWAKPRAGKAARVSDAPGTP